MTPHDENLSHFHGDTWVAKKSPLDWENFFSAVREAEGDITSVEAALYHDYKRMTLLAEKLPDQVRLREQAKAIGLLQHERGLLRQALSALKVELLAQVRGIDTFIGATPPVANGEDDRADSDPPKKLEGKGGQGD